MDFRVHLCRHGFYLGKKYSPRVFFCWPWKRGEHYARIKAIRDSFQSMRNSLANHLRRIGAQEAVIFHACDWVGDPPNSRLLRLWAWLRGDFSVLFTLQDHLRQLGR